MFFKIILPSNEIHLLTGTPTTFTELYKMILNKFEDQLPELFSLRYKDSENELVLMTGDDDFQTAISSAEAEKLRNLRIVVKKEETARYLGKKINSDQLIQKKDEKQKDSNDTKFGGIPLTESVISLPTKETEESINNHCEKNPQANNLPPWGALSGASETISNFCSPIVDLTQSQKFSFNRQESLENELNQNDQVKSDPFSKEQMDIIAQLIEKSVNKNLMEKLESIMHEAIGGEVPNHLRYSVGNKKSFPHMSPLMQSSIVSPFGMRFSSKRCKELINNECSTCCECKGKIENVRFSCLTCKNYNCCEKCENNYEHPHPLLKIKHQKASELPAHSDNIPIPQLNRGTSRSNLNAKLIQEEMAQSNQTIPIGSLTHPTSHDTQENQVQKETKETQSNKETKETTENQNSKEMQSSDGETQKSLETCQVDNFRRYKVTVVKEPIYDVIRVKAGRKYIVDYTIKNTGSQKWPNEVCLICTQGIHMGHEHKIPSLAPGKEYNIILELDAPMECGRYLSQWKLHYCEDDVFKSFGKVTYVEIEVSPNDKEQYPKFEELFYSDYQHKGGKERKKEEKQAEIASKDQELIKG